MPLTRQVPKGCSYVLTYLLPPRIQHSASTYYVLVILSSSEDRETAHSHCPQGALSNGETKMKRKNHNTVT